MHKNILNSIICLRCKNKLQLQLGYQTAENSSDIVINGTLSCSCGARYPIVETVPILLENNSLHEFLSDYYKSLILEDRHGVFLSDIELAFREIHRVTKDNHQKSAIFRQ